MFPAFPLASFPRPKQNSSPDPRFVHRSSHQRPRSLDSDENQVATANFNAIHPSQTGSLLNTIRCLRETDSEESEVNLGLYFQGSTP